MVSETGAKGGIVLRMLGMFLQFVQFFGHSNSLSHNFYDDALVSLAVEFCVENSLPRSEGQVCLR